MGGPADAVRAARAALPADGAAGARSPAACGSSPTTSRTPPPAARRRRTRPCAVLVLDGRGERASHLAGRYREDGSLEVLATQRAAALAGAAVRGADRAPRLPPLLRRVQGHGDGVVRGARLPRRPSRPRPRRRGDGGFVTEPVDWAAFAPRLAPGGDDWTPRHADLACSVQRRLEEVLLDLARVAARAHRRARAHAGGRRGAELRREHAALRGVAVRRRLGPAGVRRQRARRSARRCTSPPSSATTCGRCATAALGRGWSDDELAGWLDGAGIVHERPDDLADAVADVLAADGVVAWFQGRSEFGPRALGHRSLLADPRHAETTARLNDGQGPRVSSGRSRRWCSPSAPRRSSRGACRARTCSSPTACAAEWRDRIPAVVHVDGTARIQTVDRDDEPLMAAVLERFEERTGRARRRQHVA